MGHTISAGVAAAFVMPLLAVGAHEAEWAVAAVTTCNILHAGSSIKTWPICTRHCADLTVLPVEALRARARIVIHQILKEKQEEKTRSGGEDFSVHTQLGCI